jgi:serine/threonine protein kinase
MNCPQCNKLLKNSECPNCGFSINSPSTSTKASSQKLAGPLPVNTVIGPRKRYTVLHEIGSGGMGRTYKAIDNAIHQKICVIKEFDSDLGNLSGENLENAQKSFQAEAVILAQLRHQNMPAVWDYFEEYGRAYFAVDFIDGQHLLDLTDKLTTPLSESLLIEAGLAVCRVLKYMHSQNPPIIHRDIKPENIMFAKDGTFFLIDFGAARNYKHGRNDTIAFGTTGFASPEAQNRQTEVRSDVYSLGMTLFTLATCKTPKSYITGSFPKSNTINRQISEGLSNIISKAIELLPDSRYFANEMESALLHLKSETVVCNWCHKKVSPATETCNYCGRTIGELPGFAWEGIRGDRTNKGYRPYNVRFKGDLRIINNLGKTLVAPLVANDTVFTAVEEGRKILALNVENGKQLWMLNPGPQVIKTGYITGSYLLLPLADGRIIKVSCNEGAIVDYFQPGLPGPFTMALSANQQYLIAVAGRYICLFDYISGNKVWTYEHDQPIQTSGTFIGDSMVFGDDLGRLVCLDPNGAKAWVQQLQGGPVAGVLSYDQGYIFGCTRGGYLACYETDGSLGWGYPGSEQVTWGPCVTKDLIVTGSMGNGLTAFSKTNGGIKWKSSLVSQVVSPPIAIGDRILAFDYTDGRIAIVDFQGNKIAELQGIPGIAFPPAIYKNKVIATSLTGDLLIIS